MVVHLINTLIIIMCLCALYFNYYYVGVKYRVWVSVFVHLINTLIISMCVCVLYMWGPNMHVHVKYEKTFKRWLYAMCTIVSCSVLFSPFSTCSQDLLQELESGKQKNPNT